MMEKGKEAWEHSIQISSFQGREFGFPWLVMPSSLSRQILWLPFFPLLQEGRQGALPLDLRWAQQRVPSGGLSDHSKDGGRQAAGAWRPYRETGLFVPWEGLRPMSGRRLWTPYLPAFCQSISLKVREVLSRHLVSPGWGPRA